MIKIEQDYGKYKVHLVGSRSKPLLLNDTDELHNFVDHYYQTRQHKQKACAVCQQLKKEKTQE